jgi:hypothetical protein
MTTSAEHPPWCAQHEAAGFNHATPVGDVEVGKVVLTVDIRQHDREPAVVALGVHDAESSTTHRLSRRQATCLRDALTDALDLLNPGADHKT